MNIENTTRATASQSISGKVLHLTVKPSFASAALMSSGSVSVA